MNSKGTREKPPVKVDQAALRLGSKLGEGGMAEIFGAVSSDGPVVLRRLRKDLRFSLKMRQRFAHGVAIRRYCGDHPHIVQYLGEGGSWFSLPYEVIELVPGKNLKSMIFNKHPAITEQPLEILIQCAKAIAHVHENGYLHLDIKPENFFSTVVDGRAVVKLSDFDLCQPLTATQAPAKFGGSPMYVPPEYYERQEISPASDVFAFGVMAYHLYTNQMPFLGSVQSLLKSSKYEINYPAGVEERLPGAVRQVIEKCLKRFPKTRYQNGTELIKVLDKVKRGIHSDGPAAAKMNALLNI